MQRSHSEEQSVLAAVVRAERVRKPKPASRPSVLKRWGWAPWMLMLLPTLLASLYYGLYASDRFVSESSFVIRAAERQAPSGLMGSLLQGAGLSSSLDDTRIVHHVRSRDALVELDGRLDLRTVYSSPSIDRLSRFPRLIDLDASDEALLEHFRAHVGVELDNQTALTTLRVSGFDPAFAQRLNAELLDMSERMVNRLNDRLRADALSQAEREVERSEAASRAVASRIAAFRIQTGVFDPDRQTLLQVAQSAKLREELLSTQAQLALMRAVSPDNPQVGALAGRVRLLEQELQRDARQITGAGSASMARHSQEMQGLLVQQTSADRQLGMALASLEQARNDVRRKTLYLERVASPHRPDAPLEPRRLRAVLTVWLLGMLAWAMTSLGLAMIREHRS
jgi:capsular polysaccharide transport system permease protein